MTKKDIEEAATGAVKKSINLSNYLSQNITENDKGESWDGTVNIYNKSSKTKSAFIGRVSVQVKGTIKKDFSKSEITFSADVIDLKHYVKDNGCIYFVVYLSEDLTQEQIYYSTLTSVKLYNYLEKCKPNQKTKSITLKTFPNEGRKKATIFWNFYNDCKKQASFTPDDMLSQEDLKKLSEVTFSVSLLGYEEKDSETALLENEVHLYGKRKGTDIPIPFRFGPGKICKSKTINKPISINKVEYYPRYNVITIDKKTTEIVIGKNTVLKIIEGQLTITFSNSPMLHKRIHDAGFFVSMIENKGFEVSGTFVPIIIEDNSFYNDVQKIKEQLQICKEIQTTLDYLHIQKDINISNLSRNDIKWLEILNRGIVKKEVIYGLNESIPPVKGVKIGDLNIACIFETTEDGGYKIASFFEKNLVFIPNNSDENNPLVLPHLSTLRPREYETIDNIDYSVFIPAYEKVVQTCPQATMYFSFDALFMIEAFDNSRKKELLNLANDIFCWLEKNEENPDTEILFMNRMQIAKRCRQLTEEEIARLISIAESTDKDARIKAGANILLGNKTTAEYYINSLETKEKEEFLKYPIYHLLDK